MFGYILDLDAMSCGLRMTASIRQYMLLKWDMSGARPVRPSSGVTNGLATCSLRDRRQLFTRTYWAAVNGQADRGTFLSACIMRIPRTVG